MVAGLVVKGLDQSIVVGKRRTVHVVGLGRCKECTNAQIASQTGRPERFPSLKVVTAVLVRALESLFRE